MKTRLPLCMCLATAANLLCATAVRAGPISLTWNGWQLDYSVGAEFDGLTLRNVKFQDMPVLGKASFPVLRTFYENNLCGPYAGRIGATAVSPIAWAENAHLVAREISLNDQVWYELGVAAKLGSNDVYQVWYLSADGGLDAYVFIKGSECRAAHADYPYWRFDFDIGGKNNDQIRYSVNGGWEVPATEFNLTATPDYQWQVKDTLSGDLVEIGLANEPNTAGSAIARTDFENKQVFGRLFKSSEDNGWTYGAGAEVPFNNNENIDGHDVVFWYKGRITHPADEAPSQWHSSGIHLAVQRAGHVRANHPPSIVAPSAQTVAVGATVDLPITATDADGDPLSFSVTGLPLGLTSSSMTGRISGVPATKSAGTYRVTLAVSDGQASAATNFLWTVTRNDASVSWSHHFDFESGLLGWQVNPQNDDSATIGHWEAANPEATSADGAALQLGGCAGGKRCLVTDGRAGVNAAAYDVDSGRTSIQSPLIDLTGKHSARLKFAYYFSHSANSSTDDVLRLRVVGNKSSVAFQEASGDTNVRASWQTASVDLAQFLGQSIHLIFEATDAGPASLVEAAIDDVIVEGN